MWRLLVGSGCQWLAVACSKQSQPPAKAAEASPSAVPCSRPLASASRRSSPDDLASSFAGRQSDCRVRHRTSRRPFPALLQRAPRRRALRAMSSVNAGCLGRPRRLAVLPAPRSGLSEGDVRILVLELGANDGLRGLPVAAMKANLKRSFARPSVGASRCVTAWRPAATTARPTPPNSGGLPRSGWRRNRRVSAFLPRTE
jgi:hypothetical protein